jgi:hypothetical protein
MRAGYPSTPEQAGGAVLELHVAELKQLFDAMDPVPFRERDLDSHAHAYIVDRGRGGTVAAARNFSRRLVADPRREARLYDRLSEMDVSLLSVSSAARRAEETLAS